MEDLQQQSLRVLQCLAATLDASPDRRIGAEAQLSAEEQRPQYGVALARIALSPGDQVPQDLRQLAAVVLKNYCRWAAKPSKMLGLQLSTECAYLYMCVCMRTANTSRADEQYGR